MGEEGGSAQRMCVNRRTENGEKIVGRKVEDQRRVLSNANGFLNILG